MRRLLFSSLVLSLACGAPTPTASPIPCPAAPVPPATDAGPEASTPDASTTDAAVAYKGHGAASVPREVLAKFAPPPLPDELSRKVQSMLDVRAPGAGRTSPDGKKLYFTWNVTGVAQVWRLDGPQRFPVQLTGGEDATTVAAVSPDGTFLVLSRDRKGEENPGLYVMPAEGGPATLVQHVSGVQTVLDFVSDDGKWLYFHANDKKPNAYALYRWERATGKREVVYEEDGLWSVADHRPDGRLLLEKAVGGNMSEFYELDPKTRALTPLFGQGEREDHRARYGAKEGEVLVLTPKLGEFRRLYRWSAGKLTPVTPELPYDVADFSIDHARTRVLYTLNEGGYTRARGLDARTWKPIEVPAFPTADHVDPVATTPDGKRTTFSVDPGDGPRKSFVYDWPSRTLAAWHTPSSPEIDTKRFARATLESYPARDGTPIPMFVRRPEKCATEVCPVVVNFHGGPEGQSVAGFNATAQLYVDAGFVYVLPNVRGSDGYGKKWLHADDGPKRMSVITDIEDASKFIRDKWKKGDTIPKVGVMGGSYGGYSTLVAMTMFAGAYDAGAEAVGMSNLVTFLENTAPYRRALRASEYGDPEKDREALVALSPMTYIDRLKAPLLITQGASDPRVPVGEAVQIQRTLEDKHVDSRLIVFEDEGHGAQKRGNRVLEVGHMLRFFQQHLQGAHP